MIFVKTNCHEMSLENLVFNAAVLDDINEEKYKREFDKRKIFEGI